MQKEVYEFISKKTNDPIIERRTCRVSGEEFAITQKDREFYEKISPTFDGKKFQIPFPTLCPEERQRRRLIQRNERYYYRAKCALTGKPIISNINPKRGEPIYDSQIWRSDKRDAMEYAQDIKQESSFFIQFNELKKQVPKVALMNDNNISSENCEYTYDILYCKDCYMTMEAISDRLTHYSFCVHRSENMVDCTIVYDSKNCIECIDSYNLYACVYVQYSNECKNVMFAWDCIGCSDCIGCVGLQNMQYCVFNKQVTKEEYITYKEKLLYDILQGTSDFYQKWKAFLYQQTKLTSNQVVSERAYGNNLLHSSDIFFGFELSNCQKSRYMYNVLDAHNCYDIDVSTNIDHCLECVTPDLSNNVLFSTFCSSCHWVYYSEMCHRCTNCFGCVGLKDKQYCILNKQYTKDEYEGKVVQIISGMKETSDWGEYFPAWTGSYPYNFSDAMQRFGLTDSEAKEKGYTRSYEEISINIPQNMDVIDAKDLDAFVDGIDNDILNKAIICETSGRPFRIIASELELYHKMTFPFPRKHPDIRHQKRLAKRPGRELYLRKCDKTGEEILSVYPEGVPFKVYSEEAYRQEIYG